MKLGWEVGCVPGVKEGKGGATNCRSHLLEGLKRYGKSTP